MAPLRSWIIFEDISMIPESDTSLIVLDTNVVLDFLVFCNPTSMRIWADVREQKLRWITTGAMREEFIDVLARGLRGPSGIASWDTLQSHWNQWAEQVDEPTVLPIHFPRCTDQDDQIFVDLALGQGAGWLISRDRAVLKLAHRCRALGLSVLTPEQYVQGRQVQG